MKLSRSFFLFAVIGLLLLDSWLPDISIHQLTSDPSYSHPTNVGGSGRSHHPGLLLVNAETIRWRFPGVNGNWMQASNWKSASGQYRVPTQNDDVIIGGTWLY